MTLAFDRNRRRRDHNVVAFVHPKLQVHVAIRRDHVGPPGKAFIGS
jgi:hypothetical protein